MLERDLQWWLDWANTAYLWSLVIGALAAFLIAGTSWFVIRWQKEIQSEKDAAFAKYKLDASRDIAEAQKAAAEAIEKAEQERLARVKIEQRLAPRRMSLEDMVSLIEAMRKWSTLPGGEKQSVAVFPVATTFEAGYLADQLATALASAGWSINRNRVTFGMGIGAVLGVGILTRSNERGIAVAQGLARTLDEIGVAAAVLDRRRRGCEEMKQAPEEIAKNPWCSQISVMVGDHP